MRQKLLTIQEASEFLGISSKTLRRWEERGLLIPLRTTGNQRRFSFNQLRDFRKLGKKNTSFRASHITSEPPSLLTLASMISSHPQPQKSFEKGGVDEARKPHASEQKKWFETLYEILEIKNIRSTIHVSHIQKSLLFGAVGVLVLVFLGVMTTKVVLPTSSGLLSFVFQTQNQKFSEKGLSGDDLKAVLGVADAQTLFNFNIPVLFNEDIEVGGSASISGDLTAPNVIYSLTPGTGLSVAGTQTPTITNTDPGSAQNIFKTMKVGSTSIAAGSNTDTFSFAAGSNISLSADTSGKKLTIAASTTFSGITLAGTSGTNQTLSDGDTLTIAADNGITTTGASTDKVTVGLDVTTTSTTTTTNANSGLETSSAGLSLLRGCSDSQTLQWDATNVYWECAAAGSLSGSGTANRVAYWSDTSTLSSNANFINFSSTLFTNVGQISLGSAAQSTGTAFVVVDNPAITATANQNFYKMLIDNTAAVTVPTGTATTVATLALDEPNITETGTATNATTLYISGAPTEGDVDSNFAIWVDDGEVRFENTPVTGSTTGRAVTVNPAYVVEATDLTLSGIRLALNGASNTDSGDVFYGFNADDFTTTSGPTEYAFRVGSGYDYAMYFELGTRDLRLAVTAPSAGTSPLTATIPALGADDTFCLATLANCTGAGGGSGVTYTSQTTNALAKFTSTTGQITSSGITDDGTTVQLAANRAFTLAAGSGSITQSFTPAGTTTPANALSTTSTFGLDTTDVILSGIFVDADTNGNTDSGDTLNGILVDLITASSASEYGIQISSGWDSNLYLNDTTSRVLLADGGSIVIHDGTNTLCTVTDSGTTGDLSCTGSITGGSSGTQGFWSRTSTTLSPATANDVVSITSNDNTNATLAIVNNTATTLGVGGDTAGVVNITSSSVSTGDLVNIAATGLTTGNAVSISSSSTAGGASGNSYLLNLSRSGTNSNTAHTAYGIYSAVTNTNVTSGTNVAGYFSASGATTANYGLIVGAGIVGLATTAPDAALEINHATGDSLRLSYNDSDGSAANYTDFSLSSTGALTLTGSNVTLADSASAEKTYLTLTPGTTTLTGTTQVTSVMDTAIITGTTIAASGATTVNDASALTVTAPVDSTNTTLTRSQAIRIADTSSGAGTLTSLIGLYIAPQTGGATNNYGVCFDCDGTWTSSTVASGIQFGTDANAVTLYRSASDMLKTDDSFTVGVDLTVSGNDITFGNAEGIDNNSNGTINFSVDSTSALKVGSTGISSIGNVAHTIVDSSGALAIDSATTGAINIGTGANAKTITIGNATSGTALAFNSGTGSQTFTSKVVTGTTTTSGFVFDAGDITSGTGAYFTTDSIQDGKLVDITSTGNTQTSGTLLNISSTATSLTGTATTGGGLLGNLSWNPGSSATATGDLFRLHIGSNGTTTGSLFNVVDNTSSIFSISEVALTTSLPTNFTAAGDVSIAYDINFTNPTASFIKSAAPMVIQAGETFNSSDLALKTFNQGSVVVDSAATTGTMLDILGSTLTSGTGINFTGSSSTGVTGSVVKLTSDVGSAGMLVNLAPDFSGSGVTGYGIKLAGTDATAQTNTDYGFHSTLTLTGNAAKTGAGYYSTVTSSSTTGDTLIAFDAATSSTGTLGATTRSNYGLRSIPVNSGANNNASSVINMYGGYFNPQSTGPTNGTSSVYGVYIKSKATHASDAGTVNNYGLYVANDSTASTNGTSTKYGIYVEAMANADTNYALYTAGGTVQFTCTTNATTWTTSQANPSCADYAEVYQTDDTMETGDLVAIDQLSAGKVKKSTSLYQNDLVGIYSTSPGVLIGPDGIISGGANSLDQGKVPVALTGRVPTKVSTENGHIAMGDYLTSSSTPGVAMKATRPGPVIGKALEEFKGTTGSTCTTSTTGSEENARDTRDTCDTRDTFSIGKIMVFVNVSFADPNSVLANLSFDVNGNLVSTVNGNETSIVNGLRPSSPTNDTGIVTDQTATQSASLPPSPFTLENDPLFTNLQQTVTDLQQKIDVLESQLISNATSSASLLSSIASSSAVLGTTTYSLQPTTSSSSANLNSTLTDLDVATATISGNLIVSGRTLLNDLGITGKIQTGLLTIDGLNNEINTLAGDLKLQSSKLAGIDILNGTVTIDTKGNITTLGTVTAKEVKTDKLTITDTSPSLNAGTQSATSSATLSASAGTAIITAGTTSIDISTSALTPNSLIFTTPERATSLGAKAKDDTTFTITVTTPPTSDLKVNWWIVDRR